MPASRINIGDITKRRVTRAMAKEFNIYLPDVGPFSPAAVRPLPDQRRARNPRSYSSGRGKAMQKPDLNSRIKSVYAPYNIRLPSWLYDGQPPLLRQNAFILDDE
ncbi:hypothetical protein Glove_156g14 [Diversispora epigaea]|uniref:Uncharacterized protein n=1 Tax=Diversispora epigaea TaxID=1348612 RepID=A0A397IS17_9GLOM|nr:hypothetical protein Glove_156g14 [Diversispora epigaea]